MPPLNNARHERFCLALLEGKSADEAFVIAGYKRNRGNASRLKANESVSRRLQELQAEAAANAEVTVASICKELDEANAVARERGQAAAMVSAATLRAKLAGLMVERIETGNPGDFDNLTSTAQIVDKVLERLVEQFVPIDQRDREGLIQLYERHLQETEEYLASIRARPIVAERTDVRRLDRPWQDHEPYSPKSRIGYRGNGTKGDRAGQ
jgi:hypothetical protein